MSLHRLFIAAAIMSACATMSVRAQNSVPTQRPVQGISAVRSAISPAQARQLSSLIGQRAAASTLTIDPRKVTAAAGPQSAPVEASGTPPSAQLAPTQPPSPKTAPAQVSVIKTTPAEDKLLTRAIAGNTNLRSALSLPTTSLIPLSGVVRMNAENGPELQLKPYILVNQPLQRDSSGRYKGELLIGVSEIADNSATRSLPTPLLFQIIGAARSDPEKILINSTSPPFQPVEVWLNAAQGAMAKLLVVSVIDHAGTQVSLPVASELDIDTGNGSIAGWGMETTKITVSLNNVADAATRMVTLHVEPSGYLDKPRLQLDASGTAEAELRSGGLGTVQVRATSPGLTPVTATVHYTFPFLTIAASVLGGLLGAGISLLTAPPGGTGPARRLIGFGLFGVLVFALYVIGINLLPFKPQVSVGALAVFAISGLAGLLGPNIATLRGKGPAQD